MNKMLLGLAEKLHKKLERGVVKNAADYAIKYRYLAVTDENHPEYIKWVNEGADPSRKVGNVPKTIQPYSFVHFPWAHEIHISESESTVIQKAAQMGISEIAINKAFYTNDILAEKLLYVLPTKDVAGDFSNDRFDAALEASPHLRSLYSDVKNVGLKRAGTAALYIRGSNSRSALKSVDAPKMIFDEVDEMDTTKIVLGMERMSGQFSPQVLYLSTPSFDNVGINYFYKDSTQDTFFFRCPHCSKHIEMVFDIKNEKESSLVITGDDPTSKDVLKSFYKCNQCQSVLKHEQKADYMTLDRSLWVPKYPDKNIRGFGINQLYSHARAVSPANIAISYLKSRLSPEEEQEFFNNKLGITHAVEGARITDKMLNECQGTHVMGVPANKSRVVTMGIDPGHSNHYWEICDYTFNTDSQIKDVSLRSKARLLACGIVHSFDELPGIYQQYGVNFAVIDAQPQLELSMRFCQKVGNAKYCYYTEGRQSRKDITHSPDPYDYSITVDRTLWLDIALGRFKTNRMLLPRDCPTVYKEHIKTNIRAFQKDKNGNPIGRYVKGEKERDDFSHARNYCEIALAFAVSKLTNSNIENIL